ncbi:MAG: hypothetical protein ACREV7_16070 [Steroidobacteraceae bacterium]
MPFEALRDPYDIAFWPTGLAALSGLGPVTPLDGHGRSAGRVSGGELELPAHGVFFGHVAHEQRLGLG